MNIDAHHQDVARALHRAAMLYRHFAETLQKELGNERARELILKAVYAYGGQIGREARARTQAKGLPPTPGNFSDDLPSIGWISNKEEIDGETVTKIESCAFAEEWRDMDPALARLYCYVDQAKMEAYNPDFTYVHLKNTLDGDPFCRMAVRPQKTE